MNINKNSLVLKDLQKSILVKVDEYMITYNIIKGQVELINNLKEMEKPLEILLKDLDKLNNNFKQIYNNLYKLLHDLRKDLKLDTNYWMKYANKGIKQLNMIYIRVVEGINKTIESLQEEINELNERDNKNYDPNIYIMTDPEIVTKQQDRLNLLEVIKNIKK